MSDNYLNKDAGRYSATAVGTNAGVSATIAAIPGQRMTCLGFQASSDAAAIVTVESPSGSVLWRKRFNAAFNISEPFVAGTILGSIGGAMLVKVSASTTNSEANIEAMAVLG